ncbi:hypothetical protein PAPYR_453 [Paratrimastix pyriformis]|uniref:Non-specific serine/threonine protein kinase n=1 Tax=Paratrimastix pyriformis TaxID=342808 RepID=A0ABQ8UVQ7_9EUKA|nr:hypothetical protein PAPYR_453 [Paratrimastix pyriformis]
MGPYSAQKLRLPLDAIKQILLADLAGMDRVIALRAALEGAASLLRLSSAGSPQDARAFCLAVHPTVMGLYANKQLRDACVQFFRVEALLFRNLEDTDGGLPGAPGAAGPVVGDLWRLLWGDLAQGTIACPPQAPSVRLTTEQRYRLDGRTHGLLELACDLADAFNGLQEGPVARLGPAELRRLAEGPRHALRPRPPEAPGAGRAGRFGLPEAKRRRSGEEAGEGAPPWGSAQLVAHGASLRAETMPMAARHGLVAPLTTILSRFVPPRPAPPRPAPPTLGPAIRPAQGSMTMWGRGCVLRGGGGSLGATETPLAGWVLVALQALLEAAPAAAQLPPAQPALPSEAALAALWAPLSRYFVDRVRPSQTAPLPVAIGRLHPPAHLTWPPVTLPLLPPGQLPGWLSGGPHGGAGGRTSARPRGSTEVATVRSFGLRCCGALVWRRLAAPPLIAALGVAFGRPGGPLRRVVGDRDSALLLGAVLSACRLGAAGAAEAEAEAEGLLEGLAETPGPPALPPFRLAALLAASCGGPFTEAAPGSAPRLVGLSALPDGALLLRPPLPDLLRPPVCGPASAHPACCPEMAAFGRAHPMRLWGAFEGLPWAERGPGGALVPLPPSGEGPQPSAEIQLAALRASLDPLVLERPERPSAVALTSLQGPPQQPSPPGPPASQWELEGPRWHAVAAALRRLAEDALAGPRAQQQQQQQQQVGDGGADDGDAPPEAASSPAEGPPGGAGRLVELLDLVGSLAGCLEGRWCPPGAPRAAERGPEGAMGLLDQLAATAGQLWEGLLGELPRALGQVAGPLVRLLERAAPGPGFPVPAPCMAAFPHGAHVPEGRPSCATGLPGGWAPVAPAHAAWGEGGLEAGAQRAAFPQRVVQALRLEPLIEAARRPLIEAAGRMATAEGLRVLCGGAPEGAWPAGPVLVGPGSAATPIAVDGGGDECSSLDGDFGLDVDPEPPRAPSARPGSEGPAAHPPLAPQVKPLPSDLLPPPPGGPSAAPLSGDLLAACARLLGALARVGAPCHQPLDPDGPEAPPAGPCPVVGAMGALLCHPATAREVKTQIVQSLLPLFPGHTAQLLGTPGGEAAGILWAFVEPALAPLPSRSRPAERNFVKRLGAIPLPTILWPAIDLTGTLLMHAHLHALPEAAPSGDRANPQDRAFLQGAYARLLRAMTPAAQRYIVATGALQALLHSEPLEATWARLQDALLPLPRLRPPPGPGGEREPAGGSHPGAGPVDVEQTRTQVLVLARLAHGAVSLVAGAARVEATVLEALAAYWACAPVTLRLALGRALDALAHPLRVEAYVGAALPQLAHLWAAHELPLQEFPYPWLGCPLRPSWGPRLLGAPPPGGTARFLPTDRRPDGGRAVRQDLGAFLGAYQDEVVGPLLAQAPSAEARNRTVQALLRAMPPRPGSEPLTRKALLERHMGPLCARAYCEPGLHEGVFNVLLAEGLTAPHRDRLLMGAVGRVMFHILTLVDPFEESPGGPFSEAAIGATMRRVASSFALGGAPAKRSSPPGPRPRRTHRPRLYRVGEYVHRLTGAFMGCPTLHGRLRLVEALRLLYGALTEPNWFRAGLPMAPAMERILTRLLDTLHVLCARLIECPEQGDFVGAASPRALLGGQAAHLVAALLPLADPTRVPALLAQRTGRFLEFLVGDHPFLAAALRRDLPPLPEQPQAQALLAPLRRALAAPPAGGPGGPMGRAEEEVRTVLLPAAPAQGGPGEGQGDGADAPGEGECEQVGRDPVAEIIRNPHRLARLTAGTLEGPADGVDDADRNVPAAGEGAGDGSALPAGAGGLGLATASGGLQTLLDLLVAPAAPPPLQHQAALCVGALALAQPGLLSAGLVQQQQQQRRLQAPIERPPGGRPGEAEAEVGQWAALRVRVVGLLHGLLADECVEVAALAGAALVALLELPEGIQALAQCPRQMRAELSGYKPRTALVPAPPGQGPPAARPLPCLEALQALCDPLGRPFEGWLAALCGQLLPCCPEAALRVLGPLAARRAALGATVLPDMLLALILCPATAAAALEAFGTMFGRALAATPLARPLRGGALVDAARLMLIAWSCPLSCALALRCRLSAGGGDASPAAASLAGLFSAGPPGAAPAPAPTAGGEGVAWVDPPLVAALLGAADGLRRFDMACAMALPFPEGRWAPYHATAKSLPPQRYPGMGVLTTLQESAAGGPAAWDFLSVARAALSCGAPSTGLLFLEGWASLQWEKRRIRAARAGHPAAPADDDPDRTADGAPGLHADPTAQSHVLWPVAVGAAGGPVPRSTRGAAASAVRALISAGGGLADERAVATFGRLAEAALGALHGRDPDGLGGALVLAGPQPLRQAARQVALDELEGRWEQALAHYDVALEARSLALGTAAPGDGGGDGDGSGDGSGDGGGDGRRGGPGGSCEEGAESEPRLRWGLANALAKLGYHHLLGPLLAAPGPPPPWGPSMAAPVAAGPGSAALAEETDAARRREMRAYEAWRLAGWGAATPALPQAPSGPPADGTMVPGFHEGLLAALRGLRCREEAAFRRGLDAAQGDAAQKLRGPHRPRSPIPIHLPRHPRAPPAMGWGPGLTEGPLSPA